MNFLEELVLYCVVVATASIVAMVIIGYYKTKAARELKACTEIPSYDDAEKSLGKMAGAICQRMYELNFPPIHADAKHEFTMLCTFGVRTDEDIKRFIRMAHAAGFEVVLRPQKEGCKECGEVDGEEGKKCNNHTN